jgi:hypothetical protein
MKNKNQNHNTETLIVSFLLGTLTQINDYVQMYNSISTMETFKVFISILTPFAFAGIFFYFNKLFVKRTNYLKNYIDEKEKANKELMHIFNLMNIRMSKYAKRCSLNPALAKIEVKIFNKDEIEFIEKLLKKYDENISEIENMLKEYNVTE